MKRGLYVLRRKRHAEKQRINWADASRVYCDYHYGSSRAWTHDRSDKLVAWGVS